MSSVLCWREVIDLEWTFAYMKQNCKVNLKVYLCLIMDLWNGIKDDVKPFRCYVHLGVEHCFAIIFYSSFAKLIKHRIKSNTVSSDLFHST